MGTSAGDARRSRNHWSAGVEEKEIGPADNDGIGVMVLLSCSDRHHGGRYNRHRREGLRGGDRNSDDVRRNDFAGSNGRFEADGDNRFEAGAASDDDRHDNNDHHTRDQDHSRTSDHQDPDHTSDEEGPGDRTSDGEDYHGCGGSSTAGSDRPRGGSSCDCYPRSRKEMGCPPPRSGDWKWCAELMEEWK
jgi:hypothetical protein